MWPLKLLIFGGFLALIFPGSVCLAAGDVTVTPSIIDQKAKARDILEYSIVLKNSTNAVVFLYAIVNDIRSQDGQQEFIDPIYLDKSVSLARWIEISRGVVVLKPGEEITLPLTVRVNLSAKPGKYYAVVAFADGPNRAEAEQKALIFNQPKVTLNIEVEEVIIEKAQLKNFQVNGKLIFKLPVKFVVEVENIGNRGIQPGGLVNIYDRRGQEVGSLNINQNKESLSPKEARVFSTAWQAKGVFGQYKAKLFMEYGQGEGKDLQDTIYFWVAPVWAIILFAIFLITSVGLCAILIIKKIRRDGSGQSSSGRVVDLRSE